jgi:DNA (cytosine-5)-methyltransferase 1
MRIAFERAGGKCVFTSEWNEMSRRTYHANFECQSETFRGDIREVSTDDIPAHDILLAGFPCQPFSIAGVSKKNALGQPHGFSCETQGTLFFEIERILAEHRPSAFVLENVKHLLRHDRGRTFEVIRRTLEDRLNYAVEWDILDARLQCSPFRLLTLGT